MRPDWAALIAECEDPPGWTNVVGDEDALVYECACGTYSPVLAREWINEQQAEAAADWHRAHLAAALDTALDAWLGADETRERVARALDWHLPDGYGDHGCALRCGWSDEGTTDSAGEHLTDAALATLTDRSQ